MFHRRSWLLVASLVFAASLTACGDDSSGDGGVDADVDADLPDADLPDADPPDATPDADPDGGTDGGDDAGDADAGPSCTTADGVLTLPGVESTSPGCGAVRDDLVNKAYSIGVTNNSLRAPNSATLVFLNFNERDPALAATVTPTIAVAIPEDSITIDGEDSDANEWAGVPQQTYSLRPPTEIVVESHNPNALAGVDHAISMVDVWIAYDADEIYQRYRWADETQNDLAGRWTYSDVDGWQREQGPAMSAVDPSIDHELLVDEPMDASEDALYLMFNKNVAGFEDPDAVNGCAGMCHMAHVPLTPPNTLPGNVYNFGATMTTHNPGERVDAWAWRATTTNGLGLADDTYFHCGGADPDTTCDRTSPIWRTGDSAELHTYQLPRAGGPCDRTGTSVARGLVYPDPARLGVVVDVEHYIGNHFIEADMTSGLCVDQGPSQRPVAGATGALYATAAAATAGGGAEATDILPGDTFSDGDTLPGVVYQDVATDGVACARCNVLARGTWSAGVWTVELRRTLVAPNAAEDVDFTVVETD